MNPFIYDMAKVAGAIYAVGEGGRILRSTDNGQSWSIVRQAVDNATPLLAIHGNGGDIFACGSKTGNLGSILLRSSDGGLNFSEVKGLPQKFNALLKKNVDYNMYDLQMVSPTVGYISCDGAVLKFQVNADGSLTWTVLSLGTLGKAHALSFINTQEGVVVGDSGLCMVTGNGGATWTPRMGGTQKNLRDVRMISPSEIIACGMGSTIIKTTNGGASWVKQPVNAVAPSGQVVNFHTLTVEGSKYTIAGEFGKVWQSLDSGTTWKDISPTDTTMIATFWGSCADNSNLLFGGMSGVVDIYNAGWSRVQ